MISHTLTTHCLHPHNLTYLPESIGNLKCDTLYLHRNKLITLPK